MCLLFLFFGRYYVLYRLPALNFLDSRRVKAAEKEEAKRVGAHMKIIAPSSEDLVSKGTHKNIHSLCESSSLCSFVFLSVTFCPLDNKKHSNVPKKRRTAHGG